MALGFLYIEHSENGKENGSYYNIFGLCREYGFGYIITRPHIPHILST